MKGYEGWSYAPYKPYLYDTGDIYICRIYPSEGTVAFDWLPLAEDAVYTVHLGLRGSGNYETFETKETSFKKTGLEDNVDYEFFVSCGERKSLVRLARTGFVPGDVVVNYLHPEDSYYSFSGQYLCSPSFVRLPDGSLVASMDLFGHGTPQLLTLIYRSEDDGKTWQYQCELLPCFWGKLFVHKGLLYMLSVSTEYGDLLIGCSKDGGKTFGEPTVLLRGTAGFKDKGVHKNPEPVVSWHGRLWESLEWGSWGSGGHAAMVMSIDEDADLLVAENWHFTDPVPYDPTWKGTAEGKSNGCIEGALVVAEDGELYNVMRYQMENCVPNYGKAIVMKVVGPDEPLQFERVIDFPANHSKFMIKKDPVSGKYVTLASYLDGSNINARNWLVLLASDDLWHWKFVESVFDYHDADPDKIGFQYVDFEIEGDEILYLSRTGFNGAHTFHDSNYSMFGRIRDFRKKL